MKLRQYRVTAALEMSRIMEYRGNFIFKVFINSIIPLLIKISLFEAFFIAHGGTVAGYDEKSILIYQLWGALVLLILEIRSTLDHVATDIRMGQITRYLLYPISMFEIVSCQFFANLLVQGLCFLIGASLLAHFVEGFTIHLSSPAFWWACVFTLWGSLFWYLVSYTVGLIAFWLDEIWTFIVLFQLSSRFLSGNPIPLDMFPAGFQTISHWLPFQWIFFAPVKMFSENMVVPNLSHGIFVLSLWTVFLVLAHLAIWKAGLRSYSAAGM